MYISNCPAGNLRHRAWDCRLLAAKYTKMEPKIHDFGAPNAPKSKGWGGPGRLLGGSLGLLGGSWGPLGSKMAPRAKKKPKSESFDPLLGAILEPKIVQNRPQERSER